MQKNRVGAALVALATTIGLLTVGTVTSAQAQTEERVIRVLGGSTRFGAPSRTVAQLQRIARNDRASFERVIADAGLQNISGQIMDAMINGNVTRTTVAPGTHLEWMALKRRGVPGIVRNVRWGGARPFDAFQFSVETATTTYNFVVPFDCSNLSLLNEVAKPVAPAAAAAPPPPAPAPPPPPPPAAVAPAPAPPPPPVQAAPPPPPPPPPAPPAAPVAAAVSSRRPFVVGAIGKERRNLELDNGGFGAFCDPLFGVKGGMEFDVTPKFFIAPAIGVAINLDEGDRSSGFAEVEFNRVVGSGFVGAGLGVWDFTSGDNIAPSLLLHVGAPLTKAANGQAKLLFVVEGRMFLNDADDVANNYQAWAGVRYRFR